MSTGSLVISRVGQSIMKSMLVHVEFMDELDGRVIHADGSLVEKHKAITPFTNVDKWIELEAIGNLRASEEHRRLLLRLLDYSRPYVGCEDRYLKAKKDAKAFLNQLHSRGSQHE